MEIIMGFVSDHVIFCVGPILGRWSPLMNCVEDWYHHVFVQNFPVDFCVSAANVSRLHWGPIVDADIEVFIITADPILEFIGAPAAAIQI